MAEEVVSISFCYDGSMERLQHYDAIALGIFLDERPLKGVSGFVDWRLHGMLSRLVIQERFRGTLMESCLLPSFGYVPMEKVFLFGLGAVPELSVSRFNRIAGEIITTMSKAQATTFALSAWDLTRGRVAPEEAAGIIYRHILSDGEARRGLSTGTGQNRLITFIERGPWGKALRDGFRQLSDRSSELPIRLEVR